MVGSVPSAGPHHGRVASFDPKRGLGAVADDDGASYGFHATAIVKRSDYGLDKMMWTSFVGDEVRLTIEAMFQQQKA